MSWMKKWRELTAFAAQENVLNEIIVKILNGVCGMKRFDQLWNENTSRGEKTAPLNSSIQSHPSKAAGAVRPAFDWDELELMEFNWRNGGCSLFIQQIQFLFNFFSFAKKWKKWMKLNERKRQPGLTALIPQLKIKIIFILNWNGSLRPPLLHSTSFHSVDKPQRAARPQQSKFIFSSH